MRQRFSPRLGDGTRIVKILSVRWLPECKNGWRRWRIKLGGETSLLVFELLRLVHRNAPIGGFQTIPSLHASSLACIASDTDPKPRATMRRNKKALLQRLLFAAIVVALSALLVGLFYANADHEHLFPIRQLLHDELSAYGSAVATDSTNASAPVVKSQLVSFRALQPDGSLEIKHIDVDTAVMKVDSKYRSHEADTPVVVIKPRHNKQRLRSGRRLQQMQDDDSSEDLAFYRKVSIVLLFRNVRAPDPPYVLYSLLLSIISLVIRSYCNAQMLPIPVKQTAFQRRRLVDANGQSTDQNTVLPPESESTPVPDASRGVETFSAVLVGIASVVIACAAFLLLTDLQDRLRYEKIMEEYRKRIPPVRNESSGEGGGVPEIITEHRMLGPISEIDDEAEGEMSGSSSSDPVKREARSVTSTSTIFLEENCNAVEERKKPASASRSAKVEQKATTLSDQDRVKDWSNLMGNLVLTSPLLTIQKTVSTNVSSSSSTALGAEDSDDSRDSVASARTTDTATDSEDFVAGHPTMAAV